MTYNEKIVAGDMVEHVFKKNEDTKKPLRYKVIEVIKEPGLFDKMGEIFNDTGFKNLKCLSENNQRGKLSSEEVRKIRNK